MPWPSTGRPRPAPCSAAQRLEFKFRNTGLPNSASSAATAWMLSQRPPGSISPWAFGAAESAERPSSIATEQRQLVRHRLDRVVGYLQVRQHQHHAVRSNPVKLVGHVVDERVRRYVSQAEPGLCQRFHLHWNPISKTKSRD